MQKVDGHSHLAKDPNSGSVVNTDTDAFKAAKAAKKRILSEKEEKQKIQDRLDKLESLVEELINNKGQ